MVYAYNIVHSRIVHEPPLPPAVAVVFLVIPVVYRVAPELTVGGENIGRHTCHQHRSHITAQAEIIGIAPDIGAFKLNVKRDIAYQLYAVFIGVAFKPHILAEEKILRNFIKKYFLGVSVSELLHRRRKTVFKPVVKPQKALFVLDFPNSREKREIVEPKVIFLAEVFEIT